MSLPLVNIALGGVNLYLAHRAHNKLKTATSKTDKRVYGFCRAVGIVGGVMGVAGAVVGILAKDEAE